MKKRCFFLAAALLIFGCPAVSPLDENTKLNESNFMYEALSGNRPVPPADITVTTVMTDEGAVPVVSWVPDEKAVQYNIYRKKADEEKWTLLETVYGDTYTDSSINGLRYSGTYDYAVTAVDMFGRESFMPNEATVALANPDYHETANLLDVSKGTFAAVSVGGKVIVPPNKLGILLTIEADKDISAYLIQRSEGGGSPTTVAAAWKPDREPVLSAVYSTDVYYYMDVPPNQGVMYTYKITPIGEGGIVGQDSPTGQDKKDGFVYPGAVIAESGISSPAGSLTIPVTVSGETGGATVAFKVLYAAEESAASYNTLDVSHYTLSGSAPNFELDLTDGISTILDALFESSATAGNVWFQIVAQYASSGSLSTDAMASDTFEVLVKDASSTLMELPRNVQVTDGSWNGSEVETPVTITWAGSNDAAIKVYTVYRATRLNWDNGNDQTSWTIVNTVARNTSGHTFTDTTIEAPGAYFYKINPTGAADVPTENNGSLDAFVKAAVLPPAPTVTVDTQSDETGIPLNWNSLNGVSSYKVEVKGPTAASFSEAERTPSTSFKYQTTVPGRFTFKVVPVVEFFNKSGSIAEKFGPASEEKSGAVKLSDTKWIRLVMQTMMKGQGTIQPDRKTQYTWGGSYSSEYSNAEDTVMWSARSYQSHGENDKYQVYKFAGYTDANNAVSVDGILFHLYFSRSGAVAGFNGFEQGIGQYLSFSSSSDKWLAKGYNNTDADNVDKQPGPITVTGVYPGELQVWAKNNVSGVSDWNQALTYINAESGQPGLVVVGDCTDWQSYEYNSWLDSEYGFGTVVSSNPGINTSTAYSVKRSGASAFTNYSYSQVGALQ